MDNLDEAIASKPAIALGPSDTTIVENDGLARADMCYAHLPGHV